MPVNNSILDILNALIILEVSNKHARQTGAVSWKPQGARTIVCNEEWPVHISTLVLADGRH